MLQKYLQLFGFGIVYFTCVCCRKAMGRWALHLSAGLGLLAVLLMSSYAEGKLHSYINILLFLSATHLGCIKKQARKLGVEPTTI